MKKILTNSFIAFLFCFNVISLYAQTSLAKLAWQDTTGHPLITLPFQAATTDAAGNFIIAGSSYTTGEGVSALLVKYSSAGRVLWEVGGTDSINAAYVPVDVHAWGSDIYVTGMKYDSATSKSTIFLYKYNSGNGSSIWSKTYSGSGFGYDIAAAVNVDDSGYIYVAGTDQKTATESQMVVIRYDSSGNQKWVANYDTANMFTSATAMALTHTGTSVTVTGFSGTGFGSWSFVTMAVTRTTGVAAKPTWAGNGNGSFSSPAGVGIGKDTHDKTYIAGTAIESGNNTDIKIISYDTSFNERWLKTWGNADSLVDSASRMVLDADANILITGYTTASGGAKQLLVLKYNSSGTLQWSKTFSAPNPVNNCVGNDITTDANLNVYVTGYFYNSNGNANNNNFITVAYDLNGNLLWQQTYNGAGANSVANNIALDSIGDVYVSGTSISATTSTYVTLEYTQTTAFIPTDSTNPNGSFAFYQNMGQLYSKDTLRSADSIFYYTTAGNPQLFIAASRLSYVTGFANSAGTSDSVQRFDMRLVNGVERSVLPSPTVYPGAPVYAYNNFYLGYMQKPAINVTGYNRIVEKNVYTGVDWQICSTPQGIKNYFVVYPGSNPTQIDMLFSGQDSISTRGNAMKIFSRRGYIKFDTLVAYTVDSIGDTVHIAVSYDSLGGHSYAYTLGTYHTNRTLVIENTQGQAQGASSTDWSTFWGGSQTSHGIRVTTDAQGNAYFCAQTNCTDFPDIGGAQKRDSDSNYATVVASFNADGRALAATYFGGTFWDQPYGIALNSAGNVYVVGYTLSDNMPLYPPGNSSINGNGQIQAENPPNSVGDGYIAEFSNNLIDLLFSRYFGGFYDDNITGVAIDKSDNVYIVGITQSDTSFPITAKTGAYNQSSTTANGLDPSTDGFIAELNSANTLVWCTYFGGGGQDMLTDIKIAPGNGHIFIAGNTNGTQTATNDGGNTGPVCGVPSNTADFPTCNPGSGAYYQGNNGGGSTSFGDNDDAVLVELDTTGSMLWSTLFGGNGTEGVSLLGEVNLGGNQSIIAIDPSNNANIFLGGNLWCVGETGAYTFPKMYSGSQYGQDTLIGYANMAYVAEFTNRQQVWGTTFGNDSMDFNYITADPIGNIYIAGLSSGNNVYSGTSCAPAANPLVVVPSCNNGGGIYYQSAFGGGISDNYIAAFNSSNELIWSTFYGGDGIETAGGMAFDPVYSRLYITGSTYSDSVTFPLLNPGTGNYMQTSGSSNPAQLPSAFIARFLIPFGTTAINQVKTNNAGALLVYPNPAREYFTIVPPTDATSNFTLQIYDATGRMVYNESNLSLSGNIIVNVANLADGFYSVGLFNSNETLRAKLVISR